MLLLGPALCFLSECSVFGLMTLGRGEGSSLDLYCKICITNKNNARKKKANSHRLPAKLETTNKTLVPARLKGKMNGDWQ